MTVSPQGRGWRIALVQFSLVGAALLAACGAERTVDEPFPEPAAAAAQATTPAPAAANTPAPTEAPVATAAAPPTEAAMAEKPTAIAAPAAAPTEAVEAEQPTAAVAPPTEALVATEEPAPTEAATDAPAGPVALKVGNFITGGVANDTAAGTATIYRLEDGSQTLRLENFSATPGPDLFVVLSGTANPAGDGVKSGAYLELAKLKGTNGNQNYALPADFDASQFSSVSIWCRTFDVVFGYAALT